MKDRIDRYARGELSPQEARTLAQESLDSPELFDELTDVALAKAALTPHTVRTAKGVRPWRRTALLTGGLAAAAVLIFMVLPHPSRRQSTDLRPVLDPGTPTSQPVLLANGLHPVNAPVFRGDEPGSRAPQAAGSIVSMEDGSVNLDLGWLDGLANGSELHVYRGSGSVGRLQVTAVFRDRARASAVEGKPRPKDEVRVGAAEHLNALLQQVDAAFHRGQLDSAVELARQAVQWSEAAAVPPAAMAGAWNQLAVLLTLHGEPGAAQEYLVRASSAAPRTDPVYGQIQNNLGVLAELRGERDKAAANYDTAMGAASAEQWQAVERNRARVRGAR